MAMYSSSPPPLGAPSMKNESDDDDETVDAHCASGIVDSLHSHSAVGNHVEIPPKIQSTVAAHVVKFEPIAQIPTQFNGTDKTDRDDDDDHEMADEFGEFTAVPVASVADCLSNQSTVAPECLAATDAFTSSSQTMNDNRTADLSPSDDQRLESGIVLPDIADTALSVPLNGEELSVSASATTEIESSVAPPSVEDEDDEFGDFGAFQAVEDTRTTDNAGVFSHPPAFTEEAEVWAESGDNEQTEWADFSSVPPALAAETAAPAMPLPVINAPLDDRTCSSSSVLAESSSVSLSLRHIIDELSGIISSAIPLADSASDEVRDEISSVSQKLQLLQNLVGEDESAQSPAVEHSEHSDDAAEACTKDIYSMWKSLRSVEETSALTYQWSEGKTYQYYLNALHVDRKVAKMRNPKLPVYAWQLGSTALMPEKPGGSDGSTAAFTENHRKSSGGVIVTATVGSSGGSGNGVIISSAQFDWGGSGLQNPLGEGTIDGGSGVASGFDSEHLDELWTPSNASGQAAWKNDLKLMGLMADDEVARPVKDDESSRSIASLKNGTLMETLMNCIDHKQKFAPAESSLSDETIHFLDALPDLSFMLSPVLMFPLRDDFDGNPPEDIL